MQKFTHYSVPPNLGAIIDNKSVLHFCSIKNLLFRSVKRDILKIVNEYAFGIVRDFVFPLQRAFQDK